MPRLFTARCSQRKPADALQLHVVVPKIRFRTHTGHHGDHAGVEGKDDVVLLHKQAPHGVVALRALANVEVELGACRKAQAPQAADHLGGDVERPVCPLGYALDAAEVSIAVDDQVIGLYVVLALGIGSGPVGAEVDILGGFHNEGWRNAVFPLIPLLTRIALGAKRPLRTDLAGLAAVTLLTAQSA